MNHKNIITQRLTTIPLSLYIHFPWCLSKCPYCDFNSYPLSNKEFISQYVDKLLVDLKITASNYLGSRLESIYFGGGTPSLLTPNLVAKVIQETEKYFPDLSQVEITLEANPGTIDINWCQELKGVGVNRISLGAQSFNEEQLKNIRRIHSVEQSLAAISAIKSAGFTNFNIDLMFGLPKQNTAEAIKDLQTALSFEPPHLSWYQLTVDFKDSKFASELDILSSTLPCGEELWEIQQAGKEFLSNHGLNQYEVAAYCRSPDNRCQHNMNYWQYGDYLGVGAGAHGKITLDNYLVKRSWKISNPYSYIEATDFVAGGEIIAADKLPLEFMLNALRLYQPISYELFQQRTGVTINTIQERLQEAQKMGLLEYQNGLIVTTGHGKNFLNDLLELFI